MASQGRCSAMLSAVLLLVSAAAVVHGATYTVGDSTGWAIPGANGAPANYLANWAANKTFVAGDTLVFTYPSGQHNVLTVTAAAFTACTLTSPVLKSTSGNDSLVLAAGSNYYICGIPGHCDQGQKLQVNATAAPGTITPPPPASGTTPSPPSTTPSPPSATPPPPSSAAGTTVAVFSVVAAVAVSLLGSLGSLW